MNFMGKMVIPLYYTDVVDFSDITIYGGSISDILKLLVDALCIDE